jgi:hypothetical protein
MVVATSICTCTIFIVSSLLLDDAVCMVQLQLTGDAQLVIFKTDNTER